MNSLDEIINFERKQEDDYYFILGCNKNSTVEQISAEYKSRVLSCHPDKADNVKLANEQFSKLSQAKDVLLDSEKRKEYDKWRNSGVAIPFDTWKSMSHVHTSLHWGYHKEQLSLNHPSQTAAEYKQRKLNLTQAEKSQSLIELEDKMRFTLRDPSKKNSSVQWESDRSNTMLEKFRKYEI
ncbi:J domain-containing protein [Biomphalaria glabrata]|uniref:J domain-containing protein n=1 Tax=Biomphalaria glabrata TaxID=6526 RepID=A0A2C9LHW2_BIOGL|nr:J domain-containing protein [Biomphalaria glabrata]